MAERDSWAVAGILDQEEVRVALGALWTPGTSALRAKTGIRPGPGALTPGTVYASGTADGSVHVQPFQAVLQTSRATNGGAYVMTLDAVKDINILSTPANASNARNDLIIAHQADTFYGDGSSAMVVRQVVGTPSGAPADPSLAAYPDCLVLARIRVVANATVITSGNITDLRPTAPWTVGVGGLLPVPTQAARDALTGIYDGYAIYRQDHDWIETFDGTTWRVQDTPTVATTTDLAAITSPLTGQVANCGDGMAYRWNGSAWRVVVYKPPSQVVTTPVSSITFSNIPTYLRTLQMRIRARTTGGITGIQIQVGGDGTAAYSWYTNNFTNTSNTTSGLSNQPALFVGAAPTANTTAGRFGVYVVDIVGWDAPTAGCLAVTHAGGWTDTGTVFSSSRGAGVYNGSAAYTSLTVIPPSGATFVTGCEFILTGSE